MSPLNDSVPSPIKTAIVGYGLSGKVFHAPLLASDENFEVVAIVTADAVRQAEARAVHPHARIHSSFDKLWAEERSVDLVILSSPPDTHVDFAMRALSAGAAVVIDKPFVATVAEAAALKSAAEAAGRPLMVFQNRRWDGDFLTIQRLIAEGELGEVFSFESAFEHWAPVATSGWKDQLPIPQAGGVLYDLGSHLIDQALVLFGPAAEVSATLRRVRGGGNDDHSRVSIEHAGGVETRLLMSRVSRGLGPRFRVLGTRGSFTTYGLDGQEPALAAGVVPGDAEYGVTPEEGFGWLETDGPAGISRRRVPLERGDYPEFYRRAAAAVRGEGDLPVSLEEATAVVDILERVTRTTAD
ncbi:Gfo/Idh/MocA family protein [Microbacterium aurantiacum]|uniref:Gfo/Idh/MocA family oxidoreductase n=1 Tax=Microbacterium aurantiacum TaxID=162393 RepID=A0AAJ2HB45_9MICO|nr:Gfo/Idh/MocA family oxidoreductase [Microbacterium aurantiacum]MDS0244305.1 Gfo/Idh/MocA family oxidoreductase [Microbacterium aurantiacum]